MFELLRRLWGASAVKGGDLAVFENDFDLPFLLSPFRREEYTAYLKHFPQSVVYARSLTMQGDARRESLLSSYHEKHPELIGRVQPLPKAMPSRGQHRLGYCVFLHNAFSFVREFEAAHLPFCFTLYPGGRFQLADRFSDEMLRRVCSSPCFRKVIVTQKVTKAYLVEQGFCRPEQIVSIFGGVFPLPELQAALPPKRLYPQDKDTFDICFVAFKYSMRGEEKGYDLFVDCARRLAAALPAARFHVVGNFTSEDICVADFADRITFHGVRATADFPAFYAGMDVILSPNTPSTLAPGVFDGFPTGCCIEAGACGVAVVCTDPLRLNGPFRDRQDIRIVPHAAVPICESVMDLYGNPSNLQALSAEGQKTFQRVFGQESQMTPRIDLLEQCLLNTPPTDSSLSRTWSLPATPVPADISVSPVEVGSIHLKSPSKNFARTAGIPIDLVLRDPVDSKYTFVFVIVAPPSELETESVACLNLTTGQEIQSIEVDVTSESLGTVVSAALPVSLIMTAYSSEDLCGIELGSCQFTLLRHLENLRAVLPIQPSRVVRSVKFTVGMGSEAFPGIFGRLWFQRLKVFPQAPSIQADEVSAA